MTPQDVAWFAELFNQATTTKGDPAVAKDGSPKLLAVARLGGIEYEMLVKVCKHDVVLGTMYKRAVK